MIEIMLLSLLLSCSPQDVTAPPRGEGQKSGEGDAGADNGERDGPDLHQPRSGRGRVGRGEDDGARAVVIGGGPLAKAARALAPRFSGCTIVELRQKAVLPSAAAVLPRRAASAKLPLA